jgi:hypothetical protein
MADVNGNYKNFGNQLEKVLIGNSSEWEDAASKVGNQLNIIEEDLMTAFSVGETSEEAKDLFKKYGMLSADKPSLEGLQQKLKIKLDRLLRSYSAASQVMESMHATIMRIINAIRPN